MHALPWPSQRTLALLMVLLFTISLASIQSGSAAAQPLCLGGTIWDAQEEACVPLEPTSESIEDQAEPTPTETATIDESDDEGDAGSDEPVDDTGEEMVPTQATDSAERAGGGAVTLSITSFACPSYTNTVNLDYRGRVGACPNYISGVSYKVTIDGIEFSPSQQSPLTWSKLPAGHADVKITTPGGHKNPMVVECAIYSSTPTRTTLFADTTGKTGLTGFSTQFEKNQTWYCSVWFNELPTGMIRLEVQRCPDGMNIYGSGPNVLEASCTAPMSGIEFILVHSADGVFSTYSTGTTGAVFYPLGEGTGTVRMASPAGVGLPNIYCETTGPEGQTLSAYDWVYVSIDATFDVTFPHDAYISCDVYVVNGGITVVPSAQDPEIVEGLPHIIDDDGIAIDEDDLEGVELPDDTPAELMLVVSICDPNRDYTNPTPGELNSWCRPAREPVVEFSLTDGAGELVILHTEVNEPLVQFEDVAPGSVTISAAIPTDHAAPQVYCQTLPAGSTEPTPYTLQPACGANGIAMTVPAGSWTACDWFVIPVSAP